MSNTFIPQAVEIVKLAIEADTAGEYEKALPLYRRSLEYFMTGLKYEQNPAGKRVDNTTSYFLDFDRTSLVIRQGRFVFIRQLLLMLLFAFFLTICDLLFMIYLFSKSSIITQHTVRLPSLLHII